MSILLPVEALWELYSLDPFTGTLYSRRTGKKMKGQATKATENYISRTLVISWNGNRFHRGYGRTIHAWVTGKWAHFQVDHIDRNPFNNNLNNLRELTPRENRANSDTFKGGAYKNKSNGRWYARIWIDQKHKSLGGYATQAEGIKAYKDALMALKAP